MNTITNEVVEDELREASKRFLQDISGIALTDDINDPAIDRAVEGVQVIVMDMLAELIVTSPVQAEYGMGTDNIIPIRRR